MALLDRIGAVAQVSRRHLDRPGACNCGPIATSTTCRLRAGPGALHVNWCELTIVQEATGEQLYHNAFATNHRLTDDNVPTDRGRWPRPLEDRKREQQRAQELRLSPWSTTSATAHALSPN